MQLSLPFKGTCLLGEKKDFLEIIHFCTGICLWSCCLNYGGAHACLHSPLLRHMGCCSVTMPHLEIHHPWWSTTKQTCLGECNVRYLIWNQCLMDKRNNFHESASKWQRVHYRALVGRGSLFHLQLSLKSQRVIGLELWSVTLMAPVLCLGV